MIDFGVARAADPNAQVTLAASVTGAGVLLGTLRYMSPEQCDGDPHALDTRSDVYSLGVVLYELLTGAMPYELGDHSFTMAVRTIRDATPAAPSSVQRELRGDVERIVLKSLEKDRDRRYQSAAEFADDIRRHLADLPIRARPTGVAYRAAKFARRNRLLVGMAVLAAVAMVGGTAGVSVALVRAARAEIAEKARRAEAERRAYVVDLFAAGAAIDAQDGGGAADASGRRAGISPWLGVAVLAGAGRSEHRVLPGAGGGSAVLHVAGRPAGHRSVCRGRGTGVRRRYEARAMVQ